MQKILYALPLFLIVSIHSKAQAPEDAIRYSWLPQQGTARIMAAGGVMGSLGGDLTALFTNPAGLGFYKTGEITLSPGFLLNKNSAAYRNQTNQTDQNAFLIGPSGWIQGYGRRNKPRNSFALSLGFSQTASFNNQVQYKGYNNYSSLSEQFVEEFAQSGYSIGEVLSNPSPLPFTSAPALYTYLIDTVTRNGNLVVRGASEDILDAGQALYQEMNRRTRGGIYEISFGYAENIADRWYIGGSMGLPILSYKSESLYTERDSSSNRLNGFEQFTYYDKFSTEGLGFNIKLGTIFRPKEHIRFGFSFQSPSFFALTDSRLTNIQTTLESDSGTIQQYEAGSDLFLNGFSNETEFSQNTAWKAQVSASYVFREVEDTRRQRAFISADLEYVNHRGSRFSSLSEEPTEGEKTYYKSLNSVVKDIYKGTINARIGAEIKFHTIMFRAGFAHYGNPYKDEALKASRQMASAGIGYRDKGFFIDLTYIQHWATQPDFPYQLTDRANTFALIDQKQGQIMLTAGIKL